jgi:hypothetical protein
MKGRIGLTRRAPETTKPTANTMRANHAPTRRFSRWCEGGRKNCNGEKSAELKADGISAIDQERLSPQQDCDAEAKDGE